MEEQNSLPENSQPAEDEQKVLEAGTYDNMDTERKEKITFEVGKMLKITFPYSYLKPRELGNDKDGHFYIFDVQEDGKDKVIMTSAWTLLRGLKENEPLSGRTFHIGKRMNKSKQSYVVEPVEEEQAPE